MSPWIDNFLEKIDFTFFFALGLDITSVRSRDYMKRTDIFYIQKWGKDIFDYRKKYFYEKKIPNHHWMYE